CRNRGPSGRRAAGRSRGWSDADRPRRGQHARGRGAGISDAVIGLNVLIDALSRAGEESPMIRRRAAVLAAVVSIVLAGWVAVTAARQGSQDAAPIRVGLIGLDTSHVVAFTELLNDTSRADHVPGARVVAGYRG